MTTILAAIYIVAMAVATFIEGDVAYGTPAAKDLVYNAAWFDILHILIGINLIAVFVYNKLWKSKKYHVLFLHASLVVILLGAGITRYFGFEGFMHIREGYSSNVIISYEEYINIRVSIDRNIYKSEFPVSFTAIKETHFNQKIPLFDDNVEIKFISYMPAKDQVSLPMLNLSVSYKGETKELSLHQSFLEINEDNIVNIGNAEFEIIWGPKETPLPFALYLEDFELERYPGSMSPSSYSSDIIVKDSEMDVNMPFKIFMNNVLDYRGYRFFQSSYDKDEGGTILSVNKDPGKIPTYIGYAMLTIGFLWGFFAKKGRFYMLTRKLKAQQLFSIIFILTIMSNLQMLNAYPGMDNNQTLNKENSNLDSSNFNDNPHSQDSIDMMTNHEPTQEDILRIVDSMKKNLSNHAELFGKLLVQDFGGRIKPIDTQAMELVHKITGKDGFLGLNNVEILLGMMTYYDSFQRIKMFSTSQSELRKILGTPENEKYISFLDVFDGDDYKLENYVEEANQKDPSKRSLLEKDIIKLNEKISIAYVIYTAQILNIFPDITGSQAWLSPADAIIAFDQNDAIKVQTMLQNYFEGIDKGVKTNIWSDANNALNDIKAFQKENGGDLIPSQNRIDLEILLNNHNPFKNLTYAYMLLGLVLLIAVLVAILKNKPINKKLGIIIYALIVIAAIIHTLSLGIRWYIGDHAPWSNAYESMIYIAWAGIIAGGIFFRKSYLALSMASLMAGITLFVAHLGFMDPQIGNLVPVLKSYWLNIHVSVITASYGFFGFSFMIGVITLIMFILRDNKRPQIDQTILNLYYINELSILLGLALLTIGNFLGGVWANESWGRYWGWDSKETWSLITIVVYAFIVHMRFIPKMNSPFAFSAASLLGFYAVLMTYFGVNFYLTGKHSYASGDAVPIPIFLYFFAIGTILLIVFAARKRKINMS